MSDDDIAQTHDSNSHYFAQRCFEFGIELKRIEVIADDEAEIVEAARRLAANFDLVVTSGGARACCSRDLASAYRPL